MLPLFSIFVPISRATSVTSAGNIPFSGVSPGGVDMATGELILVMRPDLALDGPFPLVFARYYASMLAREGLASGHLGPNWLGSFDWTLSVSATNATLVTDRGAAIRFAQGSGGVWNLVSPTYANFRLDLVGGAWRITNPLDRRIYFFDGTTWLLTQILDEHGNALSLSYGSGGLLSQVSDGLGRTLSFTYDTGGHVMQVTDGTRTVHYGYTGGLLSGVTDAAGHTWSYSYVQPGPVQGLLIGVLEPAGNTPVTQSYDPSGRVMSQMDALGGLAMYSYDAPTGNVYTDPLGNAWTYQHDTGNRLVSLAAPVVGPSTYAYDTQGRLSMAMRPMGDMTSFSYDPASGYPSMVGLADGTAINWGYSSHTAGGATLFDLATAGYADGTTESYGRDASGNLTNYTDQGGFHWMGTYNARGQVLTWTNPSTGVTTFTYDASGRVATGQDNAGNTAQYGYDALGRLSQVTWPDLNVRHYAYDNLDDLTGVTDERGKLWAYGYDADGRLTTATDPLLEATGYQYDGLDRVTQVTDPLGHGTLYAYDPNGRVMSVTDASGRATTYQYDGLNRLMGVADGAGGTDVFTYDSDSRMISSADPLGHATGYAYDMMDRVTHITDPVGTGFDYAYDLMGRLHTAGGPLGYMKTFNYDARGLLTSYLNSTSETDFARSPLGEVSQVTDPNRNGWPRGYDAQGRLISSADPLARGTTYQYDGLSRVAFIGRSDGRVQQITYDPAGRVTAESYTGGPAFSYSYDDANRLTGATGASFSYDAAGRMTNSNGLAMTYDNAGRLMSETLAPGKVVTYSYDNRGLLSQLMDWMGGVTGFQYDAARRLTGITRPNGTTESFSYDAASRLTGTTDNFPGPVPLTLSSIAITRDALGRATGINRREPLMPGATSPSTNGFTYDAASQLNGVSHDALGRMTGDASRTFQWDAASRLVHYAAGADSPSFAYDAWGQVVSAAQGNQTVVQAWNYGHYPPTNDDTEVSLPSRSRLRIRTPSGMLLYTADGATGARSFYHYDEAGNTAYLTNDGSSVVAEYAYGPFGDVTGLGQTADNPYTFGAAGGTMSLVGIVVASHLTGPWTDVGGTVYDERTMRVISGNTTASGPVGANPGPISSPGDWVALNPQPFPPGPSSSGQPGPISSPGEWVALNPQPFPPGPSSSAQPGPISSPGDWVALNPQPFPPGPSSSSQPGPTQMSTMNYGYQLQGIRGMTSGISELSGNDAIVSLGGYSFAGSPDVLSRYQAGTMLHELGHSIGLNHGGSAPFDSKLSLTHRYAIFGHHTKCASDRDGDGLSDTWESAGAIDLNCDGTLTPPPPPVGAPPQVRDPLLRVPPLPGREFPTETFSINYEEVKKVYGSQKNGGKGDIVRPCPWCVSESDTGMNACAWCPR